MHKSLESRVHKLECNEKDTNQAFVILLRKMEKLMLDFSQMEAKVAELEAAEKAREARDVAQDAVTAANIAALQQSVKDLQAIIDAGTTNPADQAKIDAAVGSLTAVIDSLNAADPTPPVV